MEYTIKSGDTLSQIAKAQNTTVEALAKANQIADPNKIIAGNVLKLPEIQPTGVDMSAGEITTGIPDIPQAIPELEKDTTANAILAYTTGEQLKTAEERKKLEETAQKTLGTTDLMTAYQNRPTIDLATTRTQQLESTGATALREDVAQQSLKLAEIKGERDRLDIMEQNEIDALTKAGITRGAIERETTTIQRKYASKKAKLSADLNAEASMLAAMQGNYTMAKEAADQAVLDYVFDYQQKVDTFNNVFNTYSDLISDLNQEEKEILKTAATEAQKELDKVTQEKKDIMSLRLEYPGAGVNLNDSYEEALKKIQPYYNEANRTTQIVGSAETGYSLIDTKTGEVVKNIESISGGGSGNGNENIMSVWEIQQYSKLYGWTPPSGFTRKEIDDFVKAHPNATPAELESGAKQALLGITNDTGENINLTSDYFKSLYTNDELYKIAEKNNLVSYWNPFSSLDVDRLLKSIDSTIEQYRNQGYSDEEILENIYNNVINK